MDQAAIGTTRYSFRRICYTSWWYSEHEAQPFDWRRSSWPTTAISELLWVFLTSVSVVVVAVDIGGTGSSSGSNSSSSSST